MLNLPTGKTIADSLKPTTENVVREFITSTISDILSSKNRVGKLELAHLLLLAAVCFVLKMVLREYGIYRQDGRKICLIGAIQSARARDIDQNKFTKNFLRKRYELNKGVPDDISVMEVEPSHLLALSIFTNFLAREGITEIVAPCGYVLDYTFHEDTPYKQDSISKNKIERFADTFMRLMYHYPKSELTSFPADVDSCLHVNMAKTQTGTDISGSILQEMFGIVGNYYRQRAIERQR